MGDLSNELVRHFLIECSQKGVRLKGCPNEPYFGEDERLRDLCLGESITAHRTDTMSPSVSTSVGRNALCHVTRYVILKEYNVFVFDIE